MKTVGVICEYNPFHTGHRKQLDMIRAHFNEEVGIVCLMSGNFVQRGAPAVYHKSLRAQAALLCGADLVLELPTIYALSSAEGFAAGGVRILSGFCDYLCFGSETGTAESLMETAKNLLKPEFSAALKEQLATGCSFPAARAAALKQLGVSRILLEKPNDILAVEYCKAILQQESGMMPLVIRREGNYHDETAQTQNPSATGIRNLIAAAQDFSPYVPESVLALYTSAQEHTIKAGERAILAKLRSMTDSEFEALPYGSEGLWRKLMHASRCCASLNEIADAVKSKRYTRTRIDRMILCAYLGIDQKTLAQTAPYTRVLGFNKYGQGILKSARSSGNFPHIGEDTHQCYQDSERIWDDLYSIFSTGEPDLPGSTLSDRVFILK